MSYFLSEVSLRQGDTVTLEGEEARHLLGSRRMHAGERFALQDPQGNRFRVELVAQDRRRATVTVLEPVTPPSMPERAVCLLQAAVKERSAEWIIQKGTELGLAEIAFFLSANSTVALKQMRAEKNMARWERIAWEACKQCDRQFPPALTFLETLDDALAHPDRATPGWLLNQEGTPLSTALLGDLPARSPVRVMVGPEGGFTGEEVSRMIAAGLRPVRIGERVLRSETAALAAATLLLIEK